ncbi:hypothetical protein Poli38472_005388 [Pythium oligandrum]|uniref:Uncharacterized protein n=1 Tax=Pythium oligandrum TaxID=41045 RepID=A0A8K1CGG1_PYTOL|nr:hypothetical protein Poli38472_005388 [Pythium oligandrum]|eukprot:TMW62770.1 hypothetical protein Poli38472_005388 [Pythium oligandrum]
MSEEGEYVVEYVDDRPETTNYLKRDGMVKITYRNGDSYEGMIGSDMQKQGEGKYTWRQKNEDGDGKILHFVELASYYNPAYLRLVNDLASYEGGYVNGCKHGLGKMIFPSGDTYHGEWKQDKMHGDGSYMYANGDIFSGKFEHGIRVGKGTYEFSIDKSLLVGNWSHNTITDGKWIFKDGGSYVGRFESGKPIGTCMYKFPSGLQQDGEYVKAQETNADGEEVTTNKFVGGTIVKVR